MLDNILSTTHSQLPCDLLLSYVSLHYDLGRVTSCKFLTRGLNDTYYVATDRDIYIARVYRSGWRTEEDIAYELDILNHLQRNNISVSVPVTSTAGNQLMEIDAPEGKRYVVLFTYARGSTPPINHESSYAYGKMVAQIHNATDEFRSLHRRFELDMSHLLDQPLANITRPCVDYGGDIDIVVNWVERIKNSLPVDLLDVGFCHGDVHDWNVHWNVGQLTLFDFDCCGRGFRSYDLAVFLWNLKTNYKDKTAANWDSFITGYADFRPLRQVDFDAVPLFIAARKIWLADIYISNEAVFGSAMINEQFFSSFLGELKEDEEELSKVL